MLGNKQTLTLLLLYCLSGIFLGAWVSPDRAVQRGLVKASKNAKRLAFLTYSTTFWFIVNHGMGSRCPYPPILWGCSLWLWWHQRRHLIPQGKVSSCRVLDRLGMGRSAVAIREKHFGFFSFDLLLNLIKSSFANTSSATLCFDKMHCGGILSVGFP